MGRLLDPNEGWSAEADQLLRDRWTGLVEILRLVHESGWPNTADLEKQDVVRRWESVLRHRLVGGVA
jgi:hypothetical protein